VQSRSELAVIVGAGSGLSASLARKCAAAGMRVALAARNTDKLQTLAKETQAGVHACDAANAAQVDALFRSLDAPDLVVFNPSYRSRGPFLGLDREEVRKTLTVTAYGGFLVAQAALKRMLERGRGALFFTGASASVKGYANSPAFAMGKMGLTGLVQSMARELQPRNIHVAQVVIDGGITNPERLTTRGPDGSLDPDAIAQTYLHLHRQHRSSWASHIELRPWSEKF